MDLPNLRPAMEEKKLSIAELAALAGLSPQTVSRAIRTGSARADTCAKLVAALDLDPEYAEEMTNRLPLWFKEAEAIGARYTVKESLYTLLIGIAHPTRGFLVRATQSKDVPGDKKIADARAFRFNEQI